MRELELIDWLQHRPQALTSEILRGIGDDAAILESSGRLALSTDLLLEGCHFERRWISPWLLGCKSMRVNLSDLAAMAARPLACLLGLGLPRDRAGEFFEPFMEGFLEESQRFRCPLIGGDLSASSLVAVSVTVLGVLSSTADFARSAAHPGDLVAVAGPLGDSRLGLDLLRRREFPGLSEVESSRDLDRVAPPGDSALLRAHFLPEPQLEAATWLGQQGLVHAMMDISDGLAQDLMKLARASGLRAVLDAARLAEGGGRGHATDLDIMLYGGEDYSLLFTFDPENEERLRAEYPPGFTSWRVVGTLEPGETEVWLREGPTLRPVPPKGFEHFS